MSGAVAAQAEGFSFEPRTILTSVFIVSKHPQPGGGKSACCGFLKASSTMSWYLKADVHQMMICLAHVMCTE